MHQFELTEDSGGLWKAAGVLTFASVGAIHDETPSLTGRADGDVRLDLSGIEDADSAGLALLVQWIASSRSEGRSLTISGLPPRLENLARIGGVDGYFSC